VTVCQVRRAASAVVQSWWLDPAAADDLFERTAETIQYHQHRNAQARKSHTKATKRKLRRLGTTLAMSSRKGARAGGEKGATWVQEWLFRRICG